MSEINPQSVSFYYNLTPEVSMPSAQEALSAEKSLHCILEENQNSVLNDGLTSEEADTLLKWMVYKTRKAIANFINITPDTNCDDPCDDNQIANTLSEDSFSGYCGYGQQLIGLQAEMLGIETHYHQTSILGLNRHHAFSTLIIPVKNKEGQIELKNFLVDTTFKQFFQNDFDNRQPSWGSQLVATKEGKEVALQILRHGYIEMTPKVAQLYLEAGRRDNQNPAISTQMTDWLDILSIDSDTKGFDSIATSAVRIFDIRPPSMATEPSSIEKMDMLHTQRLSLLPKQNPVSQMQTVAGNNFKKRSGWETSIANQSVPPHPYRA